MIELVVLAVFCALAAVAVWLFVARAGREADRASNARQTELEALARIHDRYKP
jgi:hypothetical protein